MPTRRRPPTAVPRLRPLDTAGFCREADALVRQVHALRARYPRELALLTTELVALLTRERRRPGRTR